MFRPENWRNPYPCEGCPDIRLDRYGYLCDLACGKHSAYLSKEAGADAMLEALYEINKGNWIQLKRDKDGNLYILAEGL